MKINKVDDKPMVIHTKQKAKIHSHEAQNSSIKGANVYTTQRGTKHTEETVNKKIRSSTVHQKGGMKESFIKGAMTKSQQSIKTKNSSIKVAGAAGAQTALSQMEGGEEIRDSSINTATHINGNQGKAIINSTAPAGAYTILAKLNSTNGVFNLGSWDKAFDLFYTTSSTVSAGTNVYTYKVELLNELGNATFPNTVTAKTFSGSLSGNASSATKATQDGAGNVITSKYVTIDTAQIISGAKTFSKETTISSTTASTNKTTGALKVKGGIAAEGQISADKVMIGDAVTLEYNAELQCLNFVFA